MFLVSYVDSNAQYQLGLQTDEGVFALNNLSLESILQTSLKSLMSTIERAKGDKVAVEPDTLQFHDRLQVWAAGVTYKISEEARERESKGSTIYNRVYDAERPELFSKAVGYEVLGNNDAVGIRYDATWSVPEPELAIVLNNNMQVIGFTIGNDMSSRDIEGENPLYLPQAKTYYGACAIGPRIWLQPGAADYPALTIHITITRDDETVFEGETSTRNLHRPLPVLVDFLGRCKRFEYGAILLTGTGIVPPDEFTLESGDVVSITIDPIGTLTNPVRTVNRM